MCPASGVSRNFLCGLGLLAALTLPGDAASAAAPPDWLPPTPAEGARLRVAAGEPLRFALAAKAPGATVTIEADGVPAGATFRTTPGNPAVADLRWTPAAAQAGRSFAVTFTAQPDEPVTGAGTRHLVLEVFRVLARSFKLSTHAGATYRYAFVMRRTVARRAPSRSAASVARLALLTPERTTNLVLALDGKRTERGVWIRVRLPILPNNRTGWVPRRALSDWKIVRTHLVVDLRGLRLTLYRSGRPIFGARVGVGQAQWPTPRGEFYVRNMLYGFDDPFYGPIAYGTSARSAVLTDWPGGGFIGIHGTNQPGILPGRVSHGCIRLRNPDILRLARLLPVGTPLTVR
jgi:lipoprotein-anchoring transpeptidase ErfK/SrfK